MAQSFFLGISPMARKAHVHHSSFEVNDFDTQSLGHDFLRSKGWTNCWGLGRHVLGSQVFDYWSVHRRTSQYDREPAQNCHDERF